MSRTNLVLLSVVLSVCCCQQPAQAQLFVKHKSKKDPEYVKDFHKIGIIVRTYASTKFNDFALSTPQTRLVYKPNNRTSLGIGASFRFINLNIGLYSPLADRDYDKYGRTRNLDLQTHVYVKNWIVDFYAQLYRGYYLENSKDILPWYGSGQYVIRPDIRTADLSVVGQYVFNHRKFSFTAPLYQNERQKKSAGSLIAGGSIYTFRVQGDSALAPSQMGDTGFSYRFIDNNRIAGVGLNVGYTHTFVIHKWFFINGFLSGGLGIGSTSFAVPGRRDIHSREPSLNLTMRFSMGYNGDTYYAGIYMVRFSTLNTSGYGNTSQEVNTGNVRITVAKRIKLRTVLLSK